MCRSIVSLTAAFSELAIAAFARTAFVYSLLSEQLNPHARSATAITAAASN